MQPAPAGLRLLTVLAFTLFCLLPSALPAQASCAPTPLAGCTTPGKARLGIKDYDENGAGPKDKFRWKWLKGPAIPQADFGDPTATANYALCIYAGSAQALAMQASVAAASTCGAGPCWVAVGTKGYKYKDDAAGSSGISRILLKSRVSASRIVVKGEGANLDLTPSTLPLDPAADVIVQLSNSDNSNCWQATFPPASVTRNTEVWFNARTP